MKRSSYDMRSWELQRFPDLRDSDKFQETLRDSHKFLIGNAAWKICWEFGNEMIIKGCFEMPFDKVLFEYVDETQKQRRITLLAFKGTGENSRHILVLPFARQDNNAWCGGAEFNFWFDPDAKPQPTWFSRDIFETTQNPIFRDRKLVLTDIFTSTIGLLNMKDAEQTLVEVPNRLHKARLNKPPLYEYKFVELTSKWYNEPDRGGSHASPALHWRRGHIRKLKDKLIPVSPCIVGSVENGIVEKSYDGRRLNFSKKQKLAHGA